MQVLTDLAVKCVQIARSSQEITITCTTVFTAQTRSRVDELPSGAGRVEIGRCGYRYVDLSFGSRVLD